MEQVETNYTQEEVEYLNESIELGKSLDKLKKNKEYKKIIDSLFVEDATNMLVRNISYSKNKEDIYSQLEARSWFMRHIETIESNAINASQALAEMQGE